MTVLLMKGTELEATEDLRFIPASSDGPSGSGIELAVNSDGIIVMRKVGKAGQDSSPLLPISNAWLALKAAGSVGWLGSGLLSAAERQIGSKGRSIFIWKTELDQRVHIRSEDGGVKLDCTDVEWDQFITAAGEGRFAELEAAART